MIAVDESRMFLVSGNGDVMEPDECVLGIGAGGVGAQGAATALLNHTGMDAKEIVVAAMKIAASTCVFTNDAVTIESL